MTGIAIRCRERSVGNSFWRFRQLAIQSGQTYLEGFGGFLLVAGGVSKHLLEVLLLLGSDEGLERFPLCGVEQVQC